MRCNQRKSIVLRRFCAPGLLYILLLGSCSSIHLYRIDTVSSGEKPFQPGTGVSILIDEIEIHYSDPAKSIEYPIGEIFSSVGKKHGMLIVENAAQQPDLILSFWIREERFIRGISAETSICAVCTIRDAGTGKEYAKLVYTEISADTIENFYHLYSLLDICIKRTADVLEKELTTKK